MSSHIEVSHFAGQVFDYLKDHHLKTGTLFEDAAFPASNNLLPQGVMARHGEPIQWLRPKEICERLKLENGPKFETQVDRFDVKQGELGNCWFLAALASLAENKKRFRIVVPRHQKFSKNYAGIFRFRFWRMGEWTEVCVDDLLPTLPDGRLLFQRSSEDNEFWSALLEKAYAKLHGSYKALEGGSTLEAAVDFTGGIPEVVDMSKVETDETLFKILSVLSQRGSFIGSSLNAAHVEQAEALGLHRGHAYTITKVVALDDGTKLVRVRNPHGNDDEWKGAWCDNDQKWQSISEEKRKELELVFRYDGEFFMSLDAFRYFFGDLEICHLSPESADVDGSIKNFEMFKYFGEWEKNRTDGGCGNDGLKHFAKNPKYLFFINDPDPGDDQDECPVVIALAQRQRERKTEKAIGFKVYQYESGKKVDIQFFKTHKPVVTSDSFINHREVTKRCRLGPGCYCVVPCTFYKGDEAEFLLRVFIEKNWGKAGVQQNESD